MAVGLDSRTGGDGKDYQVPFRFTGKLAKLTIKVRPEQLTNADHKIMQGRLANARD